MKSRSIKKGGVKVASGLFGSIMVGFSLLIALSFFYILGKYVYVSIDNHFHHRVSIVPYVSTQDLFQIDFPNTPTINNANSTANGITVKERIYNLSQNDVEYIVSADTFQGVNISSQSQTNKQNDLQSLLNSLAESYPSTISNSQLTTFKGYDAITSNLTYTGKSNPNLPGDAIIFIANNQLYTIVGWNLSQSEYQSFINSFKLLN